MNRRAVFFALVLGYALGALTHELAVRPATAAALPAERAESAKDGEQALRELADLNERLIRHEERLRQLNESALECKLQYAGLRLRRRP